VVVTHLSRGDEGHDVHQANAQPLEAMGQSHQMPIVHAWYEHGVDLEGQSGAQRSADAAHLGRDEQRRCLTSAVDRSLVADPGIDLLPYLAVWSIDGDRERPHTRIE
jgi:hypothetical protein